MRERFRRCSRCVSAHAPLTTGASMAMVPSAGAISSRSNLSKLYSRDGITNEMHWVVNLFLALCTKVPPGCSRYEVTLTRPLGMVLEEDGNGGIVVSEISPGGNAERAGGITVGDMLVSTSGIVFTRESEYQGNMVKSGEQRVTFNVRGENNACVQKFDTVMAAIGTHKAGIPVDLTFQRC